MAERRRYTKRQKATAVIAAEMATVEAAAAATGIPRTTIDYWMDKPEFVALRSKTREDLAAEMQAIAHLSAAKLGEAIREGRLEPRDLITALGVSVDKSQLLAGHATDRVESRDITDVFDDHETRAIVDAARKHLAGDTAREDTALDEAPAVEGAGS